ncbi:MAG: multidrug resistance efflux pump [Alphaproteobacteria bacterium]|nr:multidrug resistance efflux pump [Alphaproteobacteria bacterium]|tara:strand:+ start:1832 stop:3133 length:1302 start_codon:yes stop_codon:yes gene_type:complete
MSKLDEIQNRLKPTSWRFTAWLIVFAIATGIIWANFANLEEVAVATGEVVPYGQVKVVQHLEGGIITEINVKEGDNVNSNQVLVRLDRNIIGSNREEALIELDGLLLTRARLEAEASGNPDAELIFPLQVANRRPELLAAERETNQAHKREFLAIIEVLNEKRNQRELETHELKIQLQSAKDNLILSKEKLAMSEDLLSDNLTPKLEHKKLEQEVRKLEGEIREIEASISRATAAKAEANKRIEEESSRQRRLSLDELSSVERKIARAREELSRADDQVIRSEIKSPINGVVKSIRHNTIGGIVRPGESLMEIVPTQEKLVVEAMLDPTDIGYVQVGLPATVKISTYDFTRYGGLEGVVTSISADSIVDPTSGRAFFKVITETEKTFLGKNNQELPIAPGMQAVVDIKTGSKSVLEYLLKPVINAKSQAMRER